MKIRLVARVFLAIYTVGYSYVTNAQGLDYHVFVSTNMSAQFYNTPATNAFEYRGAIFEESVDNSIGFGYSAGVLVSKIFNDKIEVGSGLVLTRYRYNTEIDAVQINAESGTSPDRAFESSINDFYYLGIPIRARMFLGEDTHKWFASATLLNYFLINHKVDGIFPFSPSGGNTTGSSGKFYTGIVKFHQYFPTINLGFGHRFVFNSGASLSITPNFECALLKVAEEMPQIENMQYAWTANALSRRRLFFVGLAFEVQL